MDDYGNISPMEQVFRDPVYSDARRSRQMDRDDIPPRMSSMDVGGNTYINRKPSLARRQSTSRRPSLKRTSTNSGITLPVDYELWRFEKIGEDWTEANRDFIPAPQKNLAKKAKTSGKVLDQMQTMVHTRRAQVNDLLEKKYKQTGFRYEPAYLEEVDAGTNRSSGKKEVRVFDIIVARAGLNGAARPSFSKSRPLSISSGRGETVRLPKNTEKDTYGDKKDKREKDVGSNKHGGKKDIKDPDPHGTSKLFAPSGKPLDLDNEAPVPFDEVDLPPHIKEDEPIGRIVPTKRRGKSRGGKSQRGDDPDEIVQVLDDDGAFRDGGAAQVLDTMVYDNILPKGKNKKGKAGRSRSRSKTPARRSKSTSRARAHAEHRGKRGERVERYMHDDHSSDSSDNGSGRSMFMMDGEDDDTSFTSSGVHRDMAERGSLHRRSSSKRSDLPFREHYRGPERDRGSKYVGEQIMIPERPIRRLSSTYYPKQQKAIGYGDDYISGPTSPRRYGVPELLYPSEIRQEDQRSERYVDGYMQEDRIYDLKQRELDERERALERKERDLRRISQGTRYVPRDSYHR